MTITPEEYAALLARPVGSMKYRKYRNTPTEVDGIRFDSKKEAARWAELQLLERAGQITNLQRQVAFYFEHRGYLLCKYVCDFCYLQDGKQVVEDVKSPASKTPLYRLKKKMMKAWYETEILET
jgi:hypothetical protein